MTDKHFIKLSEKVEWKPGRLVLTEQELMDNAAACVHWERFEQAKRIAVKVTDHYLLNV